MSTKPRIVAPGVIYQICSKGVQNLEMFKRDELKAFFLTQLDKTLKKYSFTCLAYSLTTNQYHLVLQSDQQSISNAMQHFNSIIAKRVNKVLKRDGTVFATRFKSAIVEDERLKELIRFVHLEPVKSGECNIDNLDSYIWCSHHIITTDTDSEVINKESVLKLLSISSKEEYQKFVKNTEVNKEFHSTLKNINSGKQGFQKPELWIIGKAEFVKQVIELDKCRRLRIARHISENINIEKIHDEVTSLLLMESKDLFRVGQFNIRSTARELFAALCKQRYDFTCAETAKYLSVTDSAVTRMIDRFCRINNGDYLKDSVLKWIC